MTDPFSLAGGLLFEHLTLPALYRLGLMEWEEMAQGWTLFAVYGALQVFVTFAVCLPLERWRPVERWPDQKAVAVDVLYTVLSRVGLLPILTFVVFYQVQVTTTGWLVDHGWTPPTLERFFPSCSARACSLSSATPRFSISRNTGVTGYRIGSAGGGGCTRCTTRNGR